MIRGDDHLTNTVRQLLLFEALGAEPPAYAHHAMIHGEGGGKLSKRHGATAVGEYRERGYLSEAVVNYLALLSWSHGEDEVLGRDRLVAEFALEKLGDEPGDLRPGEARLARPRAHPAARPRRTRAPVRRTAARRARRLRRRPPWRPPSSRRLSPTARRRPWRPPCSSRPALPDELRPLVAAAGEQLGELRRRRAEAAAWLAPPAARVLLAGYRAWGKERGLAAKDLLMPLRVALTSAEHGPELHYVLAALDRAETLARLDAVLPAPTSDPPPKTKGDTT